MDWLELGSKIIIGNTFNKTNTSKTDKQSQGQSFWVLC